MAGPTGKTYNFDSYVTTSPPALPPAPPKQINAGDTKYGPRKGHSPFVQPDCFSEDM